MIDLQAIFGNGPTMASGDNKPEAEAMIDTTAAMIFYCSGRLPMPKPTRWFGRIASTRPRLVQSVDRWNCGRAWRAVWRCMICDPPRSGLKAIGAGRKGPDEKIGLPGLRRLRLKAGR